MTNPLQQRANRRAFLRNSTTLSIGLGLSMAPSLCTAQTAADSTQAEEESLYLIGPREGYSPQIGTLLSTMTMMRTWVVNSVKDLSVKELDFLLDDDANSIGAMLLHLAATEKYYQLNTFDGLPWGEWDNAIKEEWNVPMNLGTVAREQIKGHDIDYYLEKLESVREDTKRGFAERDDAWLMESEPFFSNEPTNNYCKWFHVCEHESNHNGQIKMIKKRIS